jgi:hypothetical protein
MRPIALGVGKTARSAKMSLLNRLCLAIDDSFYTGSGCGNAVKQC